MGRLPSVELFTGYYFLSDFRSPDLPNREAMRSITFSFVKTNFRARNAHFSTVFIAISVVNCSVAKVRSPGVAVGSASGWRQMAAVMCGYQLCRRRNALRQNGAYSLTASKQGHCFIHSHGSIVPFPFRSGLRSRCPQTVLSG